VGLRSSGGKGGGIISGVVSVVLRKGSTVGSVEVGVQG